MVRAWIALHVFACAYMQFEVDNALDPSRELVRHPRSFDDNRDDTEPYLSVVDLSKLRKSAHIQIEPDLGALSASQVAFTEPSELYHSQGEPVDSREATHLLDTRTAVEILQSHAELKVYRFAVQGDDHLEHEKDANHEVRFPLFDIFTPYNRGSFIGSSSDNQGCLPPPTITLSIDPGQTSIAISSVRQMRFELVHGAVETGTPQNITTPKDWSHPIRLVVHVLARRIYATVQHAR
ncbi:hypothetical protein EV714DRAFT_277235 [Schizophyllum commune]